VVADIRPIQQAHRDLLRQLLPEERAALRRTSPWTYELRGADAPSGRILTPNIGGFRTALEIKISDAYLRWRNFWATHGEACRLAASALPNRKALAPREYSPRWLESHLLLLFDTVCVPLDFFTLDMVVAAGALETVVEYLDICNSIATYGSDDGDPAVVFVPTWREDGVRDLTQHDKELAASVVARVTGVSELAYVDAAPKLAAAFRSGTANYEYLDTILLAASDASVLAAQFFENRRRGMYGRLVRREPTAEDAHFFTNLVAYRFAVLHQRERLAGEFTSSLAYDADMWVHFLHRNAYIANEWGVQMGVSSNLLTRVFAIRFPWLRDLPPDQLRVIRRSGALGTFRRVTTEYEQILAGISDVAKFDEASAKYEREVASSLAAESRKVLREVRELAQRRRTTVGSFAITLASGAASIVFPELLPLTLLTAVYSSLVGSASLRDLVRTYRATIGAEQASRAASISLFLPPPPVGRGKSGGA